MPMEAIIPTMTKILNKRQARRNLLRFFFSGFFKRRYLERILAEGEGFEPPVPKGYSGFQDHPFQPLTHPSPDTRTSSGPPPHTNEGGIRGGSNGGSLLGNKFCVIAQYVIKGR